MVDRCRLRVWLTLLCGAWPGLAVAGPPYVTDDPQPTDPGHWEIYNFANGTIENGGSAVDFGVDLNYGLPDTQLTATLPLLAQTGAPLGPGMVELAVKRKLIHQSSRFPLDVAIFPRVFLPTARGGGRAQWLLPVWAEHDWGKWSLFGGGGYTLNPGPGQRDYWLGGVTLTRQLRPGWSGGLEYYAQGAAGVDQRPIGGINLGTQIHLRGPFSLLGAFGQGLSRKQTIFYAALKLDL